MEFNSSISKNTKLVNVSKYRPIILKILLFLNVVDTILEYCTEHAIKDIV